MRPGMRAKALVVVMSGGAAVPTVLTLPYTLDPSALSDGALPAPWVGGADTWEIASGVVVNDPTMGAELLTDGGLEAAYTDGKCDSLTGVAGSPTLAESADAHGGSKAQSFTSVATNNAVGFAATTGITAHQWYVFKTWGKRTAGTNGRTNPRLQQASGIPAVDSYGLGYNNAAYVERRIAKRAANANDMGAAVFHAPAETATDTILGDDCSFKQAVHGSLIKIADAGVADHVIKARSNWSGQYGVAGCVARCSLDKTSFLVAYYCLYSSDPYVYCVLDKCVNGVYTQLIATWSNSPGAGGGEMPTTSQDLEIRCAGTTVQLFHNNIQVGTDQTVSDAEIASNTHVGFFDTGGGSSNLFFVAAS